MTDIGLVSVYVMGIIAWTITGIRMPVVTLMAFQANESNKAASRQELKEKRRQVELTFALQRRRQQNFRKVQSPDLDDNVVTISEAPTRPSSAALDISIVGLT